MRWPRRLRLTGRKARPRKRCVHLVRLTLAGTDGFWFVQQKPTEAFADGATFASYPFDALFERIRPGRVITSKMDRLSTRFRNDLVDDLVGCATSQDQSCVLRGKVARESFEASMKPPAACSAPPPFTWCLVIENIKAENRS